MSESTRVPGVANVVGRERELSLAEEFLDYAGCLSGGNPLFALELGRLLDEVGVPTRVPLPHSRRGS